MFEFVEDLAADTVRLRGSDLEQLHRSACRHRSREAPELTACERAGSVGKLQAEAHVRFVGTETVHGVVIGDRSEEHTSELQSRENLVCRLLLEKKKQIHIMQQL